MVELWETAAPGAFCTIAGERVIVSIWAVGGERFRVVVDGDQGDELEAVGFDVARELAHELAGV